MFKKLFTAIAAAAIFCVPVKLYALCDITSSFTVGQVLTAAQLNTLVTDAEACSDNILNGDTFTGNMSWHSGVDALLYSDTGSTLKASIDGATGDAILSLRQHGLSSNCEINYAAGTITISGWGGVALSATNPCVVGIRSNSNGVVARAFFTTNVATSDGAASDTDGNTLGTTASVAWGNAMPIFFGVIFDGTTPYFGFSRKPHVVSGAAAGNLAQEGDTDGDGEDDFFIMTTGLTLASWVNLPITQVAWLTATKDASDQWTFAETAYTGFNQLYETQQFTLPAGQNGAESGKVFTVADGGTTLAFSTISQATYYINRAGRVVLTHAHDTQSAAGADATAVRWFGPCTAVTNANERALGAGTGLFANVSSIYIPYFTNGVAYALLRVTNSATDGSVNDNGLSNTADTVFFTIEYSCL